MDEEKRLKEKGKKHVLIKPKGEVDEAVKDNHHVQALKLQVQTLQQQNQELEKKHTKMQKMYQKLQKKNQKVLPKFTEKICFFLVFVILIRHASQTDGGEFVKTERGFC
jgi:hypothetical protein